MRRIIALLWATIICVSPLSAAMAQPKKIVNIGILSFRPIAENQKIWLPLGKQLHALAPQLDFNITSYTQHDLETMVAKGALDFAVVHPGAFIEMETKYGVSNIASLVRQTAINGNHLRRYGGVIAVLTSNKDIRSLADARGKTIASSHSDGFASFLIQRKVFDDAGIDILHDCRMIYTGQPMDNVLNALRSEKADIGFFRTGYIEEMIAKGKLKPNELTILHKESDPAFPYLHSTPLYPEWTVIATTRPEADTVKAVTSALYHIHSDSFSDYHEFSIPLSYKSTRELMQNYRVYPFNSTPSLKNIIQENSLAFTAFFALLATGSSLFTLYYFFSTHRLSEHAKQIESILATASDGIHVQDLNGNPIMFSDSFADMLGYTREELLKLSVYDWDHNCDPEKIHLKLQELIGKQITFETVHTRKDGTQINAEIHARGIVINDNHYIYASSRDITERKQTEIKLLKHKTIVENIAEGVYSVDNNNQCNYINQAALALLGLKEEEIIGQSPHLVFHYRHISGADFPSSECLIQAAILNGHAARMEDVFVRKSGSTFPVSVTVSPIMQEGTVIGSVVTFEDITEQKLSQQQLMTTKEHYDHLAHHDLLTGLPNRLSLVETLKADTSKEKNGSFAFFFLDLDGFKEINDSYGHRFGDKLLVRVSKLLKKIFPHKSYIVRTGGDEFVVLLAEYQNRDYIRQIMSNLIEMLNRPFNIDDTDVYITASVGIATYPEDARTSEELLQNADAAMYNAKKMGKNTFSFYTADLTENALHRTTIAMNLKKAIPAKELVPYFQPQIDPFTGQIIGMEVLLRWFSSEGVIPPSVFIPIAEETGLILEVGEFVLYEGCKMAAKWANEEILQGHIAINVSARQLIHPDFLIILEKILYQTQCNPAYIELEITESSILENPEKMISLLALIKSKGFNISIDDFGTGYSSLSYLKNLPIDKLKIDQSFVRDITRESKNQTIVKTIIALTQGLGIQSLAEGVETEEELEFLRLNGINSIQGYYYHKPMPENEIEVLLRHHGAH